MDGPRSPLPPPFLSCKTQRWASGYSTVDGHSVRSPYGEPVHRIRHDKGGANRSPVPAGAASSG